MSIKQTPWLRTKRKLKWILNKNITEGVFLLLGAIVALIWANSSWYASYDHLWEQKLLIRFGSLQFEQNLHHLVNDGLMAIFFFLIGLEIKREVMVGELSTLRKALFPVICAAGGMLLPALIYFLFNPTGDASRGWGIPMATDIAFALVLISVLGKRIPVALKVFLAALAIADDLGAVMVIAIFYTDEIVINSLLIAFSVFALLIAANRFGIRNSWFYGLVGLFGVWLTFLQSGIHATIAGILIAMAIPTDILIKGDKYAYRLKQLGRKFKRAEAYDHQMATDDQLAIVGSVKKVTKAVMPPLQKIEHAIAPFVSYLILPLFALANAGVRLETSFLEAIQSPVSQGIAFGLVVGKIIGVLGFARLFTWLGVTQIPAGVSWRELFGAAAFAGIGFTMSLFIAELAFTDKALLVNAKFGILLASFIATSIGLTIFLGFRPKKKKVTLPSEQENTA